MLSGKELIPYRPEPYGAPLCTAQAFYHQAAWYQKPASLGHCLFLNMIAFFLCGIDEVEHAGTHIIP